MAVNATPVNNTTVDDHSMINSRVIFISTRRKFLLQFDIVHELFFHTGIRLERTTYHFLTVN